MRRDLPPLRDDAPAAAAADDNAADELALGDRDPRMVEHPLDEHAQDLLPGRRAGDVQHAPTRMAALEAGLHVEAVIAVAFGCPYEGPVPVDRVIASENRFGTPRSSGGIECSTAIRSTYV